MKREKGGTTKRGELARHLVGYSVAAGAVLAAAGHASADIVYSGPLSLDFGSQQVTMEGVNPDVSVGGWSWQSTYGSAVYSQRGLEAGRGYWSNPTHTTGSSMNQNWGSANVRFHATMKTITDTYDSYSIVAPRAFAVALSQSATMGPGKTLDPYGWVFMHFDNKYGQWGNWAADGQKAFLGIRFEEEGTGVDLYGWGGDRAGRPHERPPARLGV